MPYEITLRLTESAYPYVHVAYAEGGLSISYGFKAPGGGICPAMTEHIAFADYPELRGLHDGCAWNLTELFCLFDWEGHYLTMKQRQPAQAPPQTAPLRPLEDAQTQQVFDFIVAYFDTQGWPPTVAEIAAGVYISQGMVNKHLTTLEAWSYISRDARKCRALRLLYHPTRGQQQDDGRF